MSIPDSTTKQCSTCKRTLSISEFNRCTSNVDGYKGQCKDCRRTHAGNKNKRTVYPKIDGLKRCYRCGEYKPATLEYFNQSQRENDALRRECRTCRKGEYAENPELNRRRSHEWSIQNRGRYRENGRRWYHAHKHDASVRQYRKEYYAKTKEYKTKYALLYRHTYPDRARVVAERRRARKLNLPYAFTAQDWQRCLDYFDYRCAICGKPRGLWHTLAQDHWIPLKSPDCIGTIPENILPLCHNTGHGDIGCNNEKSSRDPREWLISKFGTRRANQILRKIDAYFTWIKENKQTS